MITVFRRFISALALIITLLVAHSSAPICEPQGDFVESVVLIVRDLEYLNSRGVDVSSVVVELNRAIEFYSGNNYEEAYSCLNKARSLVEELKYNAESAFMGLLLIKALTVAILGSLPLLVYTLLPRAYLYLWFKFHKKWVVRR